MKRGFTFLIGLLILSTSLVLYSDKRESVQIPGSNVVFDLVLIEGGKFKKEGRSFEISPFWMGEKELSYDAFTLFQHRVNDTPISSWTGGTYSVDAISRPTPQYIDYTFGMGSTGGFPAVSATQQGALRFCEWLYYKTGSFYRLPTEAEWEYACLGRKKSKNNIDEVAWHAGNSGDKYHKSGEKLPNDLGLFDMLGNVAEWTMDQYQADYPASVAEEKDPWVRPTSKHGRSVKGGSFYDDPENCTCTSRVRSSAKWQERDPNLPKSIWWNTDAPNVGFRLVRPVNQPSHEEIIKFFQTAIVLE